MSAERITSRGSAPVVHARTLARDRSFRRERGEMFCDGVKLLSEAVSSSIEILSVFTSDEKSLPPLPYGTRVFAAPQDIISSISPLNTPQEVVFTAKMPVVKTLPEHCILLENMQDPGNVGTVIRSADAFGAGVLLTGACADFTSPKALRASMGAAFRVPIAAVTLDGLSALPIPLYASDMEGEDIRASRLPPCIVAVGNEGSGLSDELLSLCVKRISIPMSGQTESLNAAVAASVILWEMSK